MDNLENLLQRNEIRLYVGVSKLELKIVLLLHLFVNMNSICFIFCSIFA